MFAEWLNGSVRLGAIGSVYQSSGSREFVVVIRYPVDQAIQLLSRPSPMNTRDLKITIRVSQKCVYCIRGQYKLVKAKPLGIVLEKQLRTLFGSWVGQISGVGGHGIECWTEGLAYILSC